VSSDIDFVITWVDGSDPKWLADRAKYAPKGEKIDESRYRDWGFLRYWFRAVEANAPWVRKIHFVTYGHIPEWLDTSNPKLHIVKHEDFIDKKYLPTFNSCAIEMNLHKIPGLSEKFVYFNDDMFLNKPVKQDFFFEGESPRDSYVITGQNKPMTQAQKINYNCNRSVDSFDSFSIKKISLRNGLLMSLRNIVSYASKHRYNSKHMPASFTKSTYADFCRLNPDVVQDTNESRFRKDNNISQWAIEFYQQAIGVTVPRNYRFAKYYQLYGNSEMISNDIKNGKHLIICINDSEAGTDSVDGIVKAFEGKYCKKSKFEREA
jgi:hypothetical protein